MEHSFPRFLLVHGPRAAHGPTSARPGDGARRVVAGGARKPVLPAGLQPFFFAGGEVGGDAVGHGDELDEEEVET